MAFDQIVVKESRQIGEMSMNREMESYSSEKKETGVSIEDNARPSGRDSLRDSSGYISEPAALLSPGSDTPSLEPDIMVQQAFAFLRMAFGPQWIEKAAQTQRSVVRLQQERNNLKETVEIANEEIKKKGDENLRLSSKVRQMIEDHGLMEQKNAELRRECDGLQRRIKETETFFHNTRAGERQALLDGAERAFGEGSDIGRFIAELSDSSAMWLGYVCISTLPWISHAESDPSLPPALPTLNALGNKFLENISLFDGPERPRLLNLAASHLSRLSQNYTFCNEEDQLFNPERHTARSDRAIPPSARVRRMTSFFVENNRTSRTQQLAEVVI
jgi:hypothetical protein